MFNVIFLSEPIPDIKIGSNMELEDRVHSSEGFYTSIIEAWGVATSVSWFSPLT
jgi:hypothetical protein